MAHEWLTTPAAQILWAKTVAKAWRDPDLKAALLARANETLEAEGFRIPEGVTVVMHANERGEIHLVIPERPDITEVEMGPPILMCSW